MKYVAYFFLLLLPILISCKQPDPFPIGELPDNKGLKKDSNAVSGTIAVLAQEFAKSESVHSEAVGIGGVETNLYKSFLLFKKTATEKELVFLTDNINPNVRAYAFWALSSRNAFLGKKVLEKRFSDKSEFEFFSGCSQFPMRMNYFFLNCLSDSLTPYEVSYYKEKISSCYTKEELKFFDGY